MQRGYLRKQPIGIVINDKSPNKAIDVIYADNDIVAHIDDTFERNKVIIRFMGYDSFFYIKNDNKQFKKKMEALYISLSKKEEFGLLLQAMTLNYR